MPVSAQTLRLLMEAGVTGEELLDVVESIDNDQTPKRTTAAERQARYRARKSESDVTRNVTNDASHSDGDGEGEKKDLSPPTPLSKENPQPKEKPPYGGQKENPSPLLADDPQAAEPDPPPKPKPKARPKTLLPDDWQLDERDWKHARNHKSKFTDDEIRDMANGFRDHHISNQTKSADWNASWRTWCGNARKFGSVRKVGGYMSIQDPPENTIIAEIARRRGA